MVLSTFPCFPFRFTSLAWLVRVAHICSLLYILYILLLFEHPLDLHMYIYMYIVRNIHIRIHSVGYVCNHAWWLEVLKYSYINLWSKIGTWFKLCVGWLVGWLDNIYTNNNSLKQSRQLCRSLYIYVRYSTWNSRVSTIKALLIGTRVEISQKVSIHAYDLCMSLGCGPWGLRIWRAPTRRDSIWCIRNHSQRLYIFWLAHMLTRVI